MYSAVVFEAVWGRLPKRIQEAGATTETVLDVMRTCTGKSVGEIVEVVIRMWLSDRWNALLEEAARLQIPVRGDRIVIRPEDEDEGVWFEKRDQSIDIVWKTGDETPLPNRMGLENFIRE